MSRRVGVVVGVLVLLVLAVAVTAAVVAGRAVGGLFEEDRWLDRGGTTAAPTAEQVDSALRFAALAGLPPGATAGPLRVEQGIDALVVLRVRMSPDQLGPWLAASAMPALEVPATGPPAVPQHRVGRPGGGVVFRSAVVVTAGVVEVRAFET